MPTPLLVILIVFATVLGLIGLWLFLIAPKNGGDKMRPFLRPYAHRGLFDTENMPENSLPAFNKAAERGFAIELDVQLSSDGEVFVFHDATLTRMCGRDVKLTSLTAAELSATKIGSSEECIPTFREVLQTVNGRVPILIELKGENTKTALCPKVAECLAEYKGAYCVESFNPILLRWFRRHRPDVVRGLLSTNLILEKHEGSHVVNTFLTELLLDALCRPMFHAYDRKYPNSLARRVGVKWFGAKSFVFTVKNEEEYRAFLEKGIYPIFDSFIPEKNENTP